MQSDGQSGRSLPRAGLAGALFAALCIGAIGLLQVPQLRQIATESETASATQIQQQMESERMRLTLLQHAPTFGFDNLIADWTFLNFLQYFGDEAARAKTDYRLSPEFFKVVLEHNPRFLPAYTFLSTSTALYAGMPQESVAIMDKGLRQLSPTVPTGSYYAWRQRAIDELLFLGDAQAARRSFLTAAEWAAASGDPGSESVTEVSQQTAAFLASNPDSKTAQVAAWSMVLTNAPDDRTRDTAVQKIESLSGKIVANPDGSFSIQPPAVD